ncbi:MAG TPA: hypothetical protein VFE03_05685 [Caulobacteraceae bacterium]|nr:hypothetical protein [Caulobacteraceae bacterium]
MTTETIEGAAPLSRESGETAKAGIKSAEALKARAEAVRSWATSQSGVAKDWANQRAGQVKQMITDEPVMAITVSTAAAFVAGAVLGLVIGRLTAD